MNLKENETSLINMYFNHNNIGALLDDRLFTKQRKGGKSDNF